MKVIILGAGQVGFNIAKYLAVEENDVTIVDQSAELLRKIGDTLDVQPVVGFASHPDVLQQAGAADADLIIAVTGSDEVNIVACEVANSLFHVETKIARIRNQNYLDPYWSNLFTSGNLAIDHIISPEVEVAKAISRSIKVTGAFDVIPLCGNQVKVIGVRCMSNAPILNTPLRLLPGLFPKLELVIVCIVRGVDVFIPTGDHQMLPGDEVYFIVSQGQTSSAMEAFGFADTAVHRVIVMGGGNIGMTLVADIEQNQPDVITRIVEKNQARAEYVARHLKQTEVLCGDVLDAEVLSEANVQSAGTIVAVTDDDKVNILASLLAKRNGASQALILLNNMAYSSLVTSLGIDAVISPQAISVSTILQHVRQGRIRSAHSLRDGSVEIIEAEARETSHIIGLTVDDINIKGAIMVAALVREDEITVAPTRLSIRVSDRLILAVSKEAVKKVERLFAVRPSYL
ncbi:MAG: Trk system potassium transporter TrkA [Alphaproteobacteria bacterium]|jgi:trk system potassium uptake protein TrkA|nr:Trk system potassium transporter TrkA [Alphaproteobacteria bacterium]